MSRAKKLKSTYKRNRKSVSRKNGEGKFSLENVNVPTYEEIKAEIVKKIGEKPKLPKGFPKGTWTKQALRVLGERYLTKNSKGKIIESPEEMCWRVSWEIASADARWGKGRSEVKKIAEEFYHLLITHEFLPNSPTLMNAGSGNMLQYSACFVLPVEDSLVGIFDAIKYQALIHQTGGGTGFSFSRLRPSGSRVKSSSGTASGPVSFMRIFDAATNEIKQGGKRRGANMGILRADHPDILEFIHCKEDGGITNFNISVAITDKFMDAYRKGKKYDLVDPKTGKKVGKLSARKVFEDIAEGAWRTGDPGVIFLDRRNRGTSNPVPTLGPIEATNPCGEQELYPFDACNLGSIFLTYFIKKNEEGRVKVDWDKLKSVTRLATRFLDNVIEVNPYPLPQIRQTVHAIRRIGLGVGGWADMLIELGIPYDSEEALKLGKKVMRTIQNESVGETQKLAKERGPFPLWPVSIFGKGKPRRNSTVTTIAPTGTISIIAGSSSGIEPLFAIAYQHIVRDKHLDRTLTFINPKLEEVGRERGFWTKEIKKKVIEHGTIREIREIPEDIKRLFGTAHEMHHDWHIKMQDVFQKYTENAVSKTINMDNAVTASDIKKAYLLAWETSCKGITVFRDGCKDAQVLNLGVKDQKKSVEMGNGEALQDRPFAVKGATYKLHTPVGVAFITINEDQAGEPLEIFINVGKAGSDVAAMAEALGRTISSTLRFRGHLSSKDRAREIVHQLAGIGGRRAVGFGLNKIRSLPDAVAVALSNHYGFKLNGNGTFASHGKSGAQSGLAEAVMQAHNSDSIGDPAYGEVSDHTAASAQPYSAPTPPSQTGLSRSTGSDGAPVEGKDNPGHSNPTMQEAKDKDQQLTLSVTGDICPSCGSSSLVYEEGCSKCYACGHSEC
ncbi:MAG: vitamin B12-dependent ribonucleotide reductase [Patescibacteria group bacterium]